MRLEDLTIQLRTRSAWEAQELGMALVRRHAAAIWKPWLLVTLPVLIVLNAMAWALDAIWLAGLLMWWLIPVFDRIVLHVISRAVFGEIPTVAQTVRAQMHWGWSTMFHYLTWRRFSPARSLYLPVDLLEGVTGDQLRARRRALGSAVYGNAAMLMLVCVHFEVALFIGTLAGLLIFVPLELLPETLRNAGNLIVQSSPNWVRLSLNVLAWMAISIIEPFFIGAGLGLYLNRRTQLEAWDVEIVFRRLRRRLTAGAAALVMAVMLGTGLPDLAQATPGSVAVVSDLSDASDASPAANKEENEGEDTSKAPTLAEIFGGQYVDDGAFRRSAEQVYQEPVFNRTVEQKQWRRKQTEKSSSDKYELLKPRSEWLQALSSILAFLSEWGIWLVLATVIIILMSTVRYWWPWMTAGKREAKPDAPRITESALVNDTPLPDDVAAAARTLWQHGRQRHALALIYRAGVRAMGQRTQTELPPGATEAHCLRLSQKMSEPEDRQLFARIVRIWQYAAYAWHLPSQDEFESLLAHMQARGGWLK